MHIHVISRAGSEEQFTRSASHVVTVQYASQYITVFMTRIELRK